MHRPNDTEGGPKKIKGRLTVLEVDELLQSAVELAQQFAANITIHEPIRAKRHSQHLNLVSGHELDLGLLTNVRQADRTRSRKDRARTIRTWQG